MRIYGYLLVAKVAAWAWALLAFHRRPVLLGTALLAYSFGLVIPSRDPLSPIADALMATALKADFDRELALDGPA